MPHWDSQAQKREGEIDLEDRLSAYYGPPLTEQKLPSSAWQQLQGQFGTQQQRRQRGLHWRRPSWRWPQSRRSGTITPLYIQDAFEWIAHEARVPYRASILHCTFKHRSRRSAVHVSHVRKGHIRLTLPGDGVLMMNLAKLDVLLATGLARYLLTRRGHYPVVRLALYGLNLFGIALLVLLGLQQMMIIGLPIAVMCWICAAILLDWQRRRMALTADLLVVRWLGRGRACEGLHALANQERRPSRRRWGEPALTERMVRVCGLEARVDDEHLTLVR